MRLHPLMEDARSFSLLYQACIDLPDITRVFTSICLACSILTPSVHFNIVQWLKCDHTADSMAPNSGYHLWIFLSL